jgi:hypothetical protein
MSPIGISTCKINCKYYYTAIKLKCFTQLVENRNKIIEQPARKRQAQHLKVERGTAIEMNLAKE